MADQRRQRDAHVDASHRVLVDVLTVLGAYVDQTVVIGGWVPELIFPRAGHIGTMDVDLALDGRQIRPAAYDTIRSRLLKSGYRHERSGPTNVFFRDVDEGAHSIRVKLDLITGEHQSSLSERSYEHIHGMNVAKLRGVDLALDHNVTVNVSGELPGGGVKHVAARVPAVSAFVCMKAIALSERKKSKDAYDIYFCLRHVPGGPRKFAKAFSGLRGIALVEEAIESLRSHFRSEEEVGPTWVGQVAAEHGEDEELIRRDAFERAGLFLSSLPGSATESSNEE